MGLCSSRLPGSLEISGDSTRSKACGKHTETEVVLSGDEEYSALSLVSEAQRFSGRTASPAWTWLLELGLSQYAVAFDVSGFDDWELLAELEELDLQLIEQHACCVILSGHRKKILLASKQMGKRRTVPRTSRSSTTDTADRSGLTHLQTHNRVSPLQQPGCIDSPSALHMSPHALSRDQLSKDLIEPLARYPTTQSSLQVDVAQHQPSSMDKENSTVDYGRSATYAPWLNSHSTSHHFHHTGASVGMHDSSYEASKLAAAGLSSFGICPAGHSPNMRHTNPRLLSSAAPSSGRTTSDSAQYTCLQPAPAHLSPSQFLNSICSTTSSPSLSISASLPNLLCLPGLTDGSSREHPGNFMPSLGLHHTLSLPINLITQPGQQMAGIKEWNGYPNTPLPPLSPRPAGPRSTAARLQALLSVAQPGDDATVSQEVHRVFSSPNLSDSRCSSELLPSNGKGGIKRKLKLGSVSRALSSLMGSEPSPGEELPTPLLVMNRFSGVETSPASAWSHFATGTMSELPAPSSPLQIKQLRVNSPRQSPVQPFMQISAQPITQPTMQSLQLRAPKCYAGNCSVFSSEAQTCLAPTLTIGSHSLNVDMFGRALQAKHQSYMTEVDAILHPRPAMTIDLPKASAVPLGSLTTEKATWQTFHSKAPQQQLFPLPGGAILQPATVLSSKVSGAVSLSGRPQTSSAVPPTGIRSSGSQQLTRLYSTTHVSTLTTQQHTVRPYSTPHASIQAGTLPAQQQERHARCASQPLCHVQQASSGTRLSHFWPSGARQAADSQTAASLGGPQGSRGRFLTRPASAQSLASPSTHHQSNPGLTLSRPLRSVKTPAQGAQALLQKVELILLASCSPVKGPLALHPSPSCTVASKQTGITSVPARSSGDGQKAGHVIARCTDPLISQGALQPQFKAVKTRGDLQLKVEQTQNELHGLHAELEMRLAGLSTTSKCSSTSPDTPGLGCDQPVVAEAECLLDPSSALAEVESSIRKKLSELEQFQAAASAQREGMNRGVTAVGAGAATTWLRAQIVSRT